MKDKKNIAIARLIANTRTNNRPNNILEVANDILWLSNELDSLKAVSKTIRVSTEMLRRFLRVLQLPTEIKNHVEERKIDSVAVVNKLFNFSFEDQKTVVNELISGRLSPTDVKILAPLRKKLPEKKIEDLITQLRKTKPLKHYVLYFEVPPSMNDINEIDNAFKCVIDKKDIVSIEIKNRITILEVTESGKRKLMNFAKEKKLSLRRFINKLIRV